MPIAAASSAAGIGRIALLWLSSPSVSRMMTLEPLPFTVFIRSTPIASASPMAVPVSWMMPMCMRSTPFSIQPLLIVSGLSR